MTEIEMEILSTEGKFIIFQIVKNHQNWQLFPHLTDFVDFTVSEIHMLCMLKWDTLLTADLTNL